MPDSVADQAPGPVIFAVATSAERRACAAGIGNGRRREVAILQTGIGAPDAATLVERARALGPSALVSTGTGGGLEPDLHPGTVLLPRRVRTTGDEIFETAPPWHAAVYAVLSRRYDVHTGDLLSVDRVARRSDQKAELHRNTQAVGLDMESVTLARIARELDRPFLVIRTVMDTARDEVPAAALAAVGTGGDLDIAALAGRLCRHPTELKGLIVSALRYRAAAIALRGALRAGAADLLNPR